MKQLFNFAQARGFVDRSPAHPLKGQDLGVVSKIRERALDTDDEGEAQADLVEICALWRALDKAPRLSPQIRFGIKILLLTGVRSGELRLARWEHIDFDTATWKIPASNTKNAKAWTVPLSPQVLDLFKKLHKAAEGYNLLPNDYFTPHDLRRTLRTHLSRLGVAPHIAEKCLNHSLSKLGKTYDKHTSLDERREALEKWATIVDLAVNPRDNVPIFGIAP